MERQTRAAAEVVVVDDGSTDVYTRQVLARLEQRGTHVAHIDAGSASAARNLGIRATSAEYIVCLDADDVLEPGYFEAAARRLDAEPALDFVSCAMRAFGAATYFWKPSNPTFVDAVATGGVPHASTMLRRTLWESVGGFDETLPSYELLDFWATAFERGARGIVLDDPYLNYRVRPGSAYRRSIDPDTYRARLRHFYAKHQPAIERQGPDLLRAKEAFLQSQREYQRALRVRIDALEAARADLRRQIHDTVGDLASRGVPRVAWGDLRRRAPLSDHWGWDRGTPIDRYYIERFLESHRGDIRGRVLEVHDPVYTRRFGGDAVTTSDVVDIDPGNSAANRLADLRNASAIESGMYDAIIVTQTLQLVDDVGAVLFECARLLKPGGVLLVTVPTTIRVDDEAGQDGDFWRLTEASARRFVANAFPADAFEVTTFGNVMSCAAFLYGLSTEEMEQGDLDHADERFPLLVAVRAVKPHSVGQTIITPTSNRSNAGVVLSYHRIANLTPDSHSLCTSPEEFRRQMSLVRETCTPMGLDDSLRAAASGRIPDRAVAVTLDDGYLDALIGASPILTEFGIPATFFVNSDRLDEEHERWWDVLERIFLTDVPLPAMLNVSNGVEHPTLPTATPSDRAAALDWLNRHAWPLGTDGRADLLRDVLEWSGCYAPARTSHRVLMADEVRILASRPGHTIGGHTVHHLALTTQPPETTAREMREDKMTLERLLGRSVDSFAYPYGDVDGTVVAQAAAAGFHAAVTVEAGVVSSGVNRLLVPRCEASASWQTVFPERLAGLFDRAAV